MYNKSTLAKNRVPFIRFLIDLKTENPEVISFSEYYVHESRATRLVGDSTRFMTVAFTRESKDRNLKTWLESGETLTYGEGEYSFLGFTESNLKSGHLLFFRQDEEFTVEGLKEHFGDLKAVYEAFGYGKYAARLGLSFSSTIVADREEIEPEDRVLLADLMADDGSLTSDGCGLIRDSYSGRISGLLGLPLDTAVFQIRLGGIKGTLTRCPDDLFDQICGSPGKKIAYRRSMVKYNDGPHLLEIQYISKPPKHGRLNRQFIVLLLTLGIPLAVFEELLQMQLDEIDKITTHREKALECVDGEVDAEANGFYQELYGILLAGHDMNEPYLATLLRRFQTTSRQALRQKLNISVKGSGNLLGVVDHCGILEEGEVYINLPAKGGPQVGPVAVMRNPAYDPSGIRVLEAVNRPELKHLTNCIVFAASGSHSETDRMGGGDLDGDQYFVIFNPSLIPERSAPPPAASVKKPATRSKTVAIGGRAQTVGSRSAMRQNKDMRADAIETFISLRCNFHLGALSKEWMALVGTTPDLANSPVCLKLVPMIEAALDVVKSGGSIAMLKSDFDRMKISGELDSTQGTAGWQNPLEFLAGLVPQSSHPSRMEFTCDPQLVLRSSTSDDEWDTLVREAEKVMPAYNKALQNAIQADKDAMLQGLQEDEKRADAMKAAFIAKHFPPVKNMLTDIPKRLLKASVWYYTGYQHGKQSFAWLGARWLNQIKAMNSGFVPIAVGAMSTPLAATAAPRPSTPPRVQRRARLPPTPVSLARPAPVRQRVPTARAIPPPVLSSSDLDFDFGVDNSSETDSFELIDRESAYDTAVEELVPAIAGLRINTNTTRIARENSDDTLVASSTGEGESDLAQGIPKSRPRRARAPTSPVSPASDTTATARSPTRAQTRTVVAPEPETVRVEANVTTTRPRTRVQTRVPAPRAPSPEPPRAPSPDREPARTRARTRPTPDAEGRTCVAAASEARTRVTAAPEARTRMRSEQTHTHVYRILLNGPRPSRVCVCGALWTGSVNA